MQDFLDRVDPDLRDLVPLLPVTDLRGDLDAARRAARERYSTLFAQLPPVEGVSTEDVTVTGPDGDALRIRVYRPAAAGGGALAYIHGGGMVMMGIDETDYLCRRLAVATSCVVTSVDYRLAPEHPYPAPLEDCYRALDWVHDSAADLGVDASRIAVGGSSAGGGLAAGLTLLARDRGELPICFQWLCYPMLDDRNQTRSSHEITAPMVWNRANNEFGWRSYLGPRWGSEEVPIHAAPARARVEELAGLPPAYIDVGDLDLFRDENVAYAAALLQAGVPVELHVVPGAFHASEAINPAASTSRRMARARFEALARALA